MPNFLEIDAKILEKNLLLKSDSTEADNFENFFRSPENYIKDNASWVLVTPTAGFCVKTTDLKNKKVFINLCKLSEIPEPRDITEAELLELWQSDEVPDYRIPLSIQEPHDEFDKSGNPTVVYDVAVNTNFFQKIQSNMVFRSFVMQVVLEGLENKYDIELKKEGYIILQNRKCLGELKPHRIRKSKLSRASPKPLIEELHSSSTTSGSRDSTKVFQKNPKFRFYEDTCSDFVVGEFYLPHVVNLNDLTVEVNEDGIILNHCGGFYFGDFFIPIKVNESESIAHFNKNTKILTVKMPKISGNEAMVFTFFYNFSFFLNQTDVQFPLSQPGYEVLEKTNNFLLLLIMHLLLPRAVILNLFYVTIFVIWLCVIFIGPLLQNMKIVNKMTSLRLVFVAEIFSFAFFLSLALCWRNIFDILMKAQIELSPHSVLYKMWVKNQIPIHLEIHLFNFTNAKEFERNKSVLPHFEEIGPFVFEETREKVNVSWDAFQETVTFNQSKKWRLLPEFSKDFLLEVTNINPIAATIAYTSRLWQSNLQRKIVNAILNAREPFLVTASAQEWIFDGIPDKFLEVLESLKKVTEIPIPYDRFGWFYERNGSSSFEGSFTIKTGKFNIQDVGMMVAWNHKNKTDHYVDECALVYGSTGEIIPPLKPLQETVSVFGSDVCSYVTLKYSKSVDFQGLNAYEYVGDESVFDNGTFHPANACFYLGESCPSGSRNVSSCKFGSPAFISFPHFYLADKYYLNKLTGIKPDEKKHKFTFKVEPKMGIPLAVEAAFQINFLVEPYEWCDEFREVPKMYVPMMWFRQTAKMSEHYSSIIKVVLFFQSNGHIFLFCCAYFSLFILISFICWRKIN